MHPMQASGAPDSAAVADRDRARLAALRVRAAFCGLSVDLVQQDDGRTAVQLERWTLTRALPSLDHASAWLETAEQRRRGRAAQPAGAR